MADNLSYRWLLNITYMAMGEHPHKVPAGLLIEAEQGEFEVAVDRFVDVAPQLGVDTFNRCGGAIVEDFDGDGYLDILSSTIDPRGPMVYYRNLGAAGFEDLSNASLVDDQLGGLNCIGGDYDNDGDIDVLVLRGAWFMGSGRIRNSLLRNNGAGFFTDVTQEAGIAEPACPTQAAAWADLDNDGDLDLYIGNESRREFHDEPSFFPSQHYVNNGDGTFTEMAAQAGVTNNRMCKGVTAGDYDNDGDVDLYLSNIGRNRLYRNNGDGTFTDVAPALGVIEPRESVVSFTATSSATPCSSIRGIAIIF